LVILGIHGGVTLQQHDAGAALIENGKVICSIEEERLVRVKAATGYLPVNAIHACLKHAGLEMCQVTAVCIPGETYEQHGDRTAAWIRHHFGCSPKILIFNHQQCHIAAGFYNSGFLDALCLSYDFAGDRLSGLAAFASRGREFDVLRRNEMDRSLGLFYATMTSFLGFKPGEDEYKVMGLAPYGTDTIDVSDFLKVQNGGFTVNQRYYTDVKKVSQFEPYYSSDLVKLLGQPRCRSHELTQFHRDVASSSQAQLERALTTDIVTLIRSVSSERPINVVLSGGVALNCSANKKIASLPQVKGLFVEPASSDRGLAMGAAYLGSLALGISPEPLATVYTGPSYTSSVCEIERALSVTGIEYRKLDSVPRYISESVAQGKLVAFFNGRSEFGPRALGARSILADPTDKGTKSRINAKVKFREEFRPFAPAITEEDANDFFTLEPGTTYSHMTVAVDVKDRGQSEIPATTHVNNTARVQTVSSSENEIFHAVLAECKKTIGVPVLLNTSFNIMGQPIVERPLEAISTFFGCGLDSLVLGPYVIEK
jgi:carbamoyltransferase